MTTKLDPLFYLPIWEDAYNEEFGLRVVCPTQDDQRQLVNALYLCRQLSGRPEFDSLMISQVNPPGTCFIHHKLVEMPDAATAE
jgi:hypothetical protein